MNKWQKLLKWRRVFAWLPFVDFALVAGSMAMGEAHEDSDFDIILGCGKGRMFTARAFTICIFNFLGKRRKGKYTKKQSKNKFCFNHFVTPESYTLRPPYNLYWQTLYQNLVPVYGEEEKIKKFFEANAWCGRSYVMPAKAGIQGFKAKRPHPLRSPIELLLGGVFGVPLEYLLMRYQLKRIQKNIRTSDVLNIETSRLYADENELELHPDTSRIEVWIQKRKAVSKET
ncbi:MAG: hypothetical protein AAB634_02895 [Patescibacteria group bacterium]